jgi:hypothetical protein
MKSANFKSILTSICATVLFFYACNLEANSNQVQLTQREAQLIAHVKASIENAKKGVSKLTDEVLQIDGFSSPTIRHFLNNVCAFRDAVYFEVGCWKGSTLVAASYKNGDYLSYVYGMDNWSQFENPREEFFKNVDSFIYDIPMSFYPVDCFSVNTKQIFDRPVQIFFYDGVHSIPTQKAAFTYFNSIFDNVFIALVDDWNWDGVREGTYAAFRELGYKVLYEQPFFTPVINDESSWWNGFYIAVIRKPS